MSVRIKTWGAVHEHGTKFYQVIKLESDESSRAFVVTHWGPYSPGALHTPLHDGQCKVVEVKSAEADWESDRAMKAKKNRGYRFGSPSYEEFYSVAEARNRLTELLKVKDAIRIHSVLTKSDGEGITNSENEIKRLFTPPKSPDFIVKDSIPSEEKKHEDWGSW